MTGIGDAISSSRLCVIVLIDFSGCLIISCRIINMMVMMYTYVSDIYQGLLPSSGCYVSYCYTPQHMTGHTQDLYNIIINVP